MKNREGRVTRRAVLTGLAAASTLTLATARRARATEAAAPWDAVVVGAGAFGAWIAWSLRRVGQRVLLVDGAGPANSRASSGGESRMTRTIYGADEIYTRMAWDSLPQWQWLSGRSGLPVLHPFGVLMFFGRREPFVEQSLEVHRRFGMPLETLARPQLEQRYPQVAWDGVEVGLFEPGFGGLMARRAVQTLVGEFVAAGGEYRLAEVAPPAESGDVLAEVAITGGERLRARRFVFACGPWLPRVFPGVLGRRIFPTRQEVFFFAPPPGDARYEPQSLPGWADFNDGDIYYGFPDLEARGFKIAHDAHGPPIDPDTADRRVSAEGLATIRAYLRKRFPALADRPLVESRVCQYENSSNGDFLVDWHPRLGNVLLVGGGSGHGFKHGPAVGQYVADLVSRTGFKPEPRFSLASKQETQHREVH